MLYHFSLLKYSTDCEHLLTPKPREIIRRVTVIALVLLGSRKSRLSW